MQLVIKCGHNITCCLGSAQIYVDVAAALDTTEDVVEAKAMTDTNIVGFSMHWCLNYNNYGLDCKSLE